MTFRPKALHAALDAQRQARKMTWGEVADALHVSTSSLSELTEPKLFETDTVLQMTRWLGLNIESFAGEGRDPVSGPHPGDWRSTGQFLRFNTHALYEAIDAKRQAKGLTWQQASEAIGSTRATAVMLASLKKSPRIELNTMLAILAWLGVHTTRFTRLATT